MNYRARKYAGVAGNHSNFFRQTRRTQIAAGGLNVDAVARILFLIALLFVLSL